MGTLKVHRRVAGWFGYELIKQRKLNDSLEQHLVNLLTHHAINLVIDVGANMGQFALSLRRHGYTGAIESFEPLEDVCTLLQTLSEPDPHWRVHQVALGEHEGQAQLHRYAASDFSSMLTVTEFARERFKWRTAQDGVEEVPVTTLSSVWPKIVADVDSPRAFLKLDTQGFDLAVLAGATRALADIRAVQTELSLKPIYDGAPRYLEALAEFERHGFEITGMYPVSRDTESLAIIEYDCVMSRSERPKEPAPPEID